jgi:hypothetical protein
MSLVLCSWTASQDGKSRLVQRQINLVHNLPRVVFLLKDPRNKKACVDELEANPDHKFLVCPHKEWRAVSRRDMFLPLARQ